MITRKMKTYRSNSLTLEEQERLIAVTDTYEDLALLRLALTTGIRREDIAKIQVGNIDTIKRTLKFWEAKKKRWYEVPLTEETNQTLIRYLNSKKGNEKELFKFTGRTAYNRLQKYLQKAGIKKELSFHDLRRTFVKTAKKRGLSPKAVSQITGDTLAVVDRHYSNLDMDELKDEVNKL